MPYYRITYPNNYISHHGILGQKWGKKNGPPYPLDSGDHSSREKKEGWRKSLGGRRNEYKYGRKGANGVADLSEIKNKSGLTDNQKKALKIGAAVVLSGLAIYGGYKLYSSGVLNKRNLFTKEQLESINIDTIGVSKLNEGFKNDSNLCNSIVERMEKAAEDTSNRSVKGFTNPEDIRKLTDDELRALQAYTTPGFYKQVNQVAQGMIDKVDSEFFEGYDESSKTIAKDIMSAMEKMSLQKDANVQRGINHSTCQRILGDNIMQKLDRLRDIYSRSGKDLEGFSIPDLIGTAVPSRGFTSTAVPFKNVVWDNKLNKAVLKDHSVADYFSGKDGIIFNISAKAGQHAIEISNLSELSSERELLFGPNSTLLPNGTIDIIDGIIHVYCDLVQD